MMTYGWNGHLLTPKNEISLHLLRLYLLNSSTPHSNNSKLHLLFKLPFHHHHLSDHRRPKRKNALFHSTPMPSPKVHRREKNKKGRLSEKASSFHGTDAGLVAEMLPRPRTVPDLLAGRRGAGTPAAAPPPPRLSKLLVNVTVQRSTGHVHVLMPMEATVKELITAALRQYVKEARRPVLPTVDASAYDLHYSQFSLESLDKDEKLVELGSRNFFLCPKMTAAEGGGAAVAVRCSQEAEEGIKKGSPWLKFMDLFTSGQ